MASSMLGPMNRSAHARHSPSSTRLPSTRIRRQSGESAPWATISWRATDLPPPGSPPMSMFRSARVTSTRRGYRSQAVLGCGVRNRRGRYLTAILNSNVLTQMVRPLQARGEHNPRDFDKYIFQLPIPLYNSGSSEHRHLVELAERAEEAAAAVELTSGVSFQAQRRRVREALSRDGVGDELNNLTTALLTATSA